jgi:CRAL/TRIO domain
MHTCRLLRNLKKEKPDKADRDDDDDDDFVHEEPEKKEETAHPEKTPATETTKPPRPPIEANNKLRVLAYSDSDSDVESHVVQRVKDHLLPHNEEEARTAEALAAEEAVVEEERQARLKASSSGRALTRLAAAVSGVIGHCAKQLTPSIVLKTVAMMALQNVNGNAGNAVEASALVFGAAGVLVDRRARYRGNELSTRVARAQFHAVDIGKAAALAVIIRLALQAREHAISATARPRRFVARLVSGVDMSALERSMSIADPDKPPETAAEWAAVFSVEMSEMRRMLNECGIELAPPRWDETNAELMRFAETCGLKEAETPAERGIAIEKAVRRVIATVEWTLEQKDKDVGETKLRRWERLVAWRGSDANGHPMLLVRFGRALQLCAKSGRLEAFSDAIAAQVAAGVASRLSNYPGGAERIVAVVDCRETSNWEALTRSRHIVSLIKKLNTNLSAHYPGRLERVHVLELPLLARMALQSVLSPLQPSTREKITPASIDDDSLPVTVALLQKRRSYARGLGRTMSDHSLATTEDGLDTARDDDVEDEDGGAGENGQEGEEAQQQALALDGGGSSAYGSPRAELTEADFVSERETSNSSEIEVPQPATMWNNINSETITEEASGSGTSRSVNAPGQPAVDLNLPATEDSADSTNLVMVVPEDQQHDGQQLSADSPATADVATNLLEALDEAADSATKNAGNNQEESSSGNSSNANASGNSAVALPPPETGAAGLAPVSHCLYSTGTPSTLSPQSSQGANSIQDHLDSPSTAPQQEQQQQHGHPGPAGSTPGGASAAAARFLPSQGGGPLAGASAMLSSMLPSVAASGNRLGMPQTTTNSPPVGAAGTSNINTLRGASPTVASGSRSPRIRPYRLGTLSSENSLGSVPETPTTTTTTTTVLSARKGGLTDLPPRPSSTRKTPAKSSLRRPEAVKNTGSGRLASFPLRRQSSVSWSEVLTTVKEIHSTPPGGGGVGASTSAAGAASGSSSSGGGVSTPPINGGLGSSSVPLQRGQQASPLVSPFPVPPMSPEARVAIQQPAFPGLMVLIMVFGILQRLLLSI